MPWKIEKRGERHCVVKETDGSTVKCHDTRADAEAHMKALYAATESEREMHPAEAKRMPKR